MGLRGFQSSVMLNKRFSYLKGGYCKKIVLLDIIYGGNIVETGRSFVDCFFATTWGGNMSRSSIYKRVTQLLQKIIPKIPPS